MLRRLIPSSAVVVAAANATVGTHPTSLPPSHPPAAPLSLVTTRRSMFFSGKSREAKGDAIADPPAAAEDAAPRRHTAASTTSSLPYPRSYYASHSLSPKAEGFPCKGSNYSNVSENANVALSNPTKGRGRVQGSGPSQLFQNASRVEGGAWWNVRPSEATAATSASSVASTYEYRGALPKDGVTRISRLFSVPTHADAGKNGVWAFPREIR